MRQPPQFSIVCSYHDTRRDLHTLREHEILPLSSVFLRLTSSPHPSAHDFLHSCISTRGHFDLSACVLSWTRTRYCSTVDSGDDPQVPDTQTSLNWRSCGQNCTTMLVTVFESSSHFPACARAVHRLLMLRLSLVFQIGGIVLLAIGIYYFVGLKHLEEITGGRLVHAGGGAQVQRTVTCDTPCEISTHGNRPSGTARFRTVLLLHVRCPNCQILVPHITTFALNLLSEPMTSDHMISVSLIW